jgi:acyl transferase domain-containing protein
VGAVLSAREDTLTAGGVKANIGHAEPAAGMTGLLKLVLGLRAGEAAPNAQLRSLNRHVGDTLRGAAGALPTQLAAMTVGSGGVSSFGYSGTIAHALLRHAEGDGGAATVLPPLVCRRRSFPWRDPPHPFVQRVIPSSDGAIVFRSATAGTLHALVANHVVQGRVVFPGAGYLEMARAAGATALHGVYFLQPLAVEAPGLLTECALSNARFEVRASEIEAFEDATVHCSGATSTDTVWQHVEHASLRTLSRAADVGALYDGFDAVGLQYGPGYRTLINAWGGASDALARLRANSSPELTHTHAASLDDALCASAAMTSSGGGETRLPFAVDDALLWGDPGELWAVHSRNLQALWTAPSA